MVKSSLSSTLIEGWSLTPSLTPLFNILTPLTPSCSLSITFLEFSLLSQLRSYAVGKKPYNIQKAKNLDFVKHLTKNTAKAASRSRLKPLTVVKSLNKSINKATVALNSFRATLLVIQSSLIKRTVSSFIKEFHYLSIIDQ